MYLLMFVFHDVMFIAELVDKVSQYDRDVRQHIM